MGGWSGVVWIVVYMAVLLWLVRGFVQLTERRRRALEIRPLPAREKRMPAGAAAMLVLAALIQLGVYALNTYAAFAALGGAA